MNFKRTMTRVSTLSVLLVLAIQGCSPSSPAPTSTPTASPSPLPTNTLPPTPEPSPTFTPPPVPNLPTETVTPLPIATNDPNAIVVADTPTETPKSSGISRCYGMTGRIEVRTVVAEAAGLGLDPFSIGEIPFEVTSQYAPYRVAGKSKLVYKQKVEEDWGTYKGDINLMGSISGQCLTGDKDGELHLNISINGSQTVVIRSKGYNKQIPWSGGANIPLIFGHSEGYTMAGEKWLFILHMGPPKE
jgi:hypothetical protein